MSFPAIASTRANGTAVSGSDFTFGVMPTGTTSGDLLVAFGHAIEDNADYTDPSGWTRKDSEPGNSGRSFVWARVATGTDPLVFPLSALSNSVSIIVARITGWTGTDTSSVEANLLTDFSGNGDPPSITATWGSADNTFIAVCGREGANITAYPSGYSGGVTGFNEGAWGAVALASKESASATDNPGTGFSTGGSTVHVGTIVVKGSVAADTTAPTLTSPAAVATGNTTGTGSVSTNEGNGTLWRKAAASASTDPGAGNEAANGWASSAVTATGAQTGLLFTGLTTNVAVVPSYFHVDAAGNRSAVGTGSAFTPSTMAYSGTIGAQTGTQGGAFVWSGANPSTLFSGGIGTRSFSGTGLVASGLTVNSTTGVLQGTSGTPGTYSIAIVGTDQSTAGSEIPQTETSNTFTLTITASGDTTRPTMGGVVTASSVTSSSAVLTWSAASDNSGTISGYDYQVNGGSFVSLGNVLTTTLTGLASSTAYTINVRARDPSGNVSTPLVTGGFTTGSGAAGTFVSAALKRNNGVLVPSSSISWMTFVVSTTGAFVVTKTGLSTNSAGVFSTTDAALTTGTYSVLWREASGQYGWGVASVA